MSLSLLCISTKAHAQGKSGIKVRMGAVTTALSTTQHNLILKAFVEVTMDELLSTAELASPEGVHLTHVYQAL